MAIEQPAPRTPDKKAPRWRQEPKITSFPKPLQPPTAEEARAANRGDYREGRITGFIGKHPLISGTTAAGVAAAAAYEAVPAFHQAVDSLQTEAASYWKSLTGSVKPETFTNDKPGGYISRANSFPVDIGTANTDLDNYRRLHLADETTLIFPLRLPEESGVGYSFKEEAKEFDPKTGAYIMTDNKNWMFLSRVPKGTEIYAPIDGTVVSFSRNGFASGLSVMFTVEGIEYTLKIGGTTGDTIFKLAINIPSIPEYAKGAQKVAIKKGQLLMALNKDNSDIQLEFTSTPIDSRKNQENPVPIKFITATDNTGTEKLLVLEK